jgi:gliding motility-associated-like protein
MKSKNKITRLSIVLTFALSFLHNSVNGQLLVDGSLTPDSLAKTISGKGVEIFNAQVDCGTNGHGLYNASNTNLGVNQGLLITTGTINNAIGPNNSTKKSTNWTTPYNSNPQTYSLLDNYSNRTTYEYCEFEFDIVPQGDTISFDFVFASEEYEEWVGSQYNDVFGFFISGPGIVPDAGAGSYKNIALIPNTNTAVTINNVNQNANTAYYQNNNNSTHIQYDGFTRGLTAISEVVPCQTYHLILVVADASDKIYDSGVFIEKINSNNIILLSSTAGNLPHMVEGCNDGDITFKRPLGQANTAPLPIQYWLDGTATNGVDYVQIGANPNPLIPKNITIPAGSDSINLPIVTIADALPEISEYIMVYLGNPFCSNAITDSLQFFIQDSLFSTAIPLIDSICIGESVQLQSSGGSIFSWSPTLSLDNANISDPIATPTATTTYSLTTSASFCSENRISKIYVSDMSLAFNPTQVNCNGNNNGSIILTPSNGLLPYTYAWSGPNSYTSTNKDISNLSPGTYTVVVTDANGCSKNGNVTITEPTIITASLSSTTYNGDYNISCNGLFDGAATLTINGGTLPYSFSWTGPNAFSSTNQNISGLEAGVYNLTITDAKGCAVNRSITLTEPTLLVASISSSTDVGCKNEATGSALSNVSGGTPPYTYSWNSTPSQTTPAATNLYSGNYTITITDNNSCTSSVSVFIAQPTDSLNAATTSTTNVLCNGDATGAATVLASGGSTPYSYNWNSSPIQTTPSATNLPAGNYTVTVTDFKGCNVSLPISISQPLQTLNVAITDSTNVLCKGDSNGAATSIATGGSGSYSYSWNTPPIQTTPTASNLIAGTYTITVTDNNGCLTPQTANITIEEPLLDLSSTSILASYIGGYNISCFGATDGDINQTITGGTSPYTTTWTGPNGFASSTEDISSLEFGTYFLKITDANLCEFYDTLTLIQPTNINVDITVTDATCPAFSNGQIDIVVTGGTPTYTFAWTGPAAFTSISEDITGLVAGDYDLTVTDNNGCIKILTSTVSQPGSLTLSNVASSYIGGNNVSCNGGSDGDINITAAGGTMPYGFSWTGPNGFTSTLEDINTLEAGPYQVIFTDFNGCFVSDSIYLTQPELVQMTLTPSMYNGNYNISCAGSNNGTINTTPTGGISPYSFSWSGPGAYASTNQNINTLIAGTYVLTITDANGCTGIDSITLTQPDTLSGTTFSATYQGNYNISCFGLANGSIDLTVVGGTSPFTYLWTGPNAFNSSLDDINNLISGTYTIQVTDNNGCIDTTSITLTQPDSLNLSTTPSIFNGGYNVSCNGFSDGTIDLAVIGGTTPYTFNWSNGSANEDLNNIAAGTYSVIVTDTNNCSANTTINLIQPPTLQSGITSPTYIGGNNVSCNGLSDGTVDLQVSGGTPSYTYNWIGPNAFTSTIEDPSALEAGTYQVTITDTNGCNRIDYITLQEPATLNLTLNAPTFVGGYNLSCNNDSTGSIGLTVTGGIQSYNYNWNGPSSFTSENQTISNLIAGTYYITVTDTNNCVNLDSLTITEPNAISSTVLLSTFIGGNNISCNGLSDGTIDLTMNGGNPNYNYSWSGPNSFTSINEDISNLFAGVYNLNIIDTNGCFYDTTITLSEPLEMVDSIYSPTFIGGNNISCNGISDGTIDAFITGGATPFAINWTGPNAFNSSSLNIVSLEAGVYYYTVSDANTCTLNDSIELTQPDSLQSILTSTLFPSGNNIACMGDTTGLVYTNVLGGNEGFTFNWSNSGSYSNIIQNPINMLADTYHLLLTDTNGCIWNDSIVLTEPNSTINGVITPSIFPSGDNISCFGTNDGNLSILANGGTPGYLYDWRGPNGYSNDSIFIDSLYAGVYDLVVTDSNGCSLSMSFTLEDPNSILMLNDSVSTYPNGLNTSCFNVSDGSIELSPTGGSPSYSYNWTSNIGFNSSIEDISNISPGEYYIELIDTNGCVATDTFTLSQPDSMIINNLITPAICGNPIGSVNLFIEGSSPYSYLWSNGDTVSFVTNLSGGTYTAVITDMFGCIDSATYNIDDLSNQMSLDLYSPTFTGDHNISANNGSDGSIDMTILGGTPPFVIGWSNGSSTEDINNLQAGTHSATVTDANGCTTYATIELTEALPLEMPTAITPNGDGKNDFFFIRGLEVYPSNELTIFNRWGNIVFSQKDYQNDWDGTSDSGEALPEGTYFTILKIEYEGLELKGYIDIRR